MKIDDDQRNKRSIRPGPVCDAGSQEKCGMEMFPMYLKLEGRACLVVGAGNIAEPKIASLIRAGGVVTVVAPGALPPLAKQAAEGIIAWQAREFRESDLDGAFLVIAATDIRSVNHSVANAARVRQILCNSVDDPPDCDFFYPSVVNRGDLQIAISTAGKSPALAQRLRQEIDSLLPADAGAWLDRLGQKRLEILSAYPLTEARKHALHLLARRESCEPENCPVQKTLDTLLTKKQDGLETPEVESSGGDSPFGGLLASQGK